MEENRRSQSPRAGGKKPQRKYRRSAVFLLVLIAVLFVLNLIMVVRIVGLAVEARRLEEPVVASSQLV